MTPSRVVRVLSLLLLLAALPNLALAATTEFRVFFDVDADATTGCSVGDFDGIEQVLVTQVIDDDTNPKVSRTFRQICTGGILGGETDVTTGWPAAFRSGDRMMTLETRIPFSSFGTGVPESLHVGFNATRGAAVHEALTNADGTPVMIPGAPHRRRAVGERPSRMIVLDGSLQDWGNIKPVLFGIPGGGTKALRLLRILSFANTADNFIYFAAQLHISSEAPFADEDEYLRTPGENAEIPASIGVLKNDGDPNGLPLTATKVSEAARGTVTLNPDGSFTYSPNNPASQLTDEFEYKATNGTTESNVARVRIKVDLGESPEGPPVDDAYETDEDKTLVVDAPGVLDNDPGKQNLVAALVTPPSHGTVTLNADGGFTYKPALNFFGNDSFVYSATRTTSGKLVGNATVTIEVDRVNDAPSFNAGPNITRAANAGPYSQIWATNISAGAPNESGQTLTFVVTNNNNSLFSVQPTISSNGTLSFTPSGTLGTATVSVFLQDNGGVANGGDNTSPTVTFTITMTCGGITVTNPAVNTATVGTAFSRNFTQSGATGTATFTTSSPLPSGVTLAPNGTLSGTPTQSGTFPITVTVADSLGCTGTGPVYTLTVSCQTITVTNPATNTGTAGAPFSQTFTQSGALSGATFTLASGTLPAGLTLATNGVLSGTPTQTGSFPITVKVTDGNNCSVTGDPYPLNIGCPTITVNNPANGNGTANSPFNETFTQMGAVGAATFTLASGTLPAGLTLAPNGTLSGTPTQTGTFNITVTATDSNGCTGTSTPYTINIVCQTITVNNPVTTTGTTGVPFSQTFTHTNGVNPVTFTLASGTLPAGLTLAANGVLSGTPTQTGNFPITVTATDANSCAGTGVPYPLVVNQPPAITSASTANFTQGTLGSFTITTTGFPTPSLTLSSGLPAGLSFVDNTDGTGTISGTPTAAGGSYGPFTVTATNSAGVANHNLTIIICVTPSVSISASQTTFCDGTNVVFTATPVNGGTSPSYQWTLNGNPVGTNSPTFATSTLANGDQVAVTMTSNEVCTTTNPVTSNTIAVTVNANPATPAITPAPTQVCASSAGNTASGPAGATSYAWSIVNGTITSAANTQNITYTAGTSGTVDLTLVVTNASGCPASNTVNVPINANPATPSITPTPAQVCANSTGNTADGPAGATSYAWSIVNGTITSATNIQNITYTAGPSGTVDLTLVVTNASGCSASNTVNVPINANPAPPTITPTPAQVCASSAGNTADGPAGAATYAWSIVNGTITSATNTQTITYTAGPSGTVDLTLVVTNASGCSASNTVNVPINANPVPPTITPTPAQVCASSAGNTASGPAGATTYAWSIVNGTITSATNAQNVTYTAGLSGTVDLTLVVTNASGCPASSTVNVPINPSPATPTITPTPAQVCANSTGNTADGPAGATSYAWSIVNGTITSAANIQNITYTAGPSGTVDLTLVVTNAGGCPASNTVNVPINANPATPTITPNPAQVCASSAGNTADGPAGAATYAWSIVNGTITSATNTQSITYTAGPSGTVDLTLVVTNASGCSASNTVNVPINANPAAPTITPTPAQVCASSAGNTASGPAGATTYAWSIVNGTITSATNAQNITYTAGPSGTVDLTLVVTNASGCSASSTVNVPINASPATPTITPSSPAVCGGSTGNTASGPAGATSYAWSIVNGTITSATNAQNVTYTAGATGTVDLTLVVTNAGGCPASNTVSVTINPSPAAPTITPAPTQVCASSVGNTASGPAGAATYAWSIVNGTITSATNAQNITYTAGPSGTVDLTLVVTNASGCAASNTVNVPINANPAPPTITPTPATVCEGSTGNTASGPAGAATYAWSIVNGTITSAMNTQSITYTAGTSGTVGLTLVVTNAAGCSASNTVNVTINPTPAAPTITPTPTQVCGGSVGNTAAGPAGATTYAWSIVNGTITSATNIQNIVYTAGPSGTVDLTLVVTNASGCPASTTINVPINASPATPTITPSTTEVCANTTGHTAAGPAGATTYAWSIVNGTITSATNIQNITWDAGSSGPVTLQLTVTNASGCSASNSTNVTINPAVTLSPAPGALADAIYHNGYSQSFTAGGGTPAFTYAISPGAPSGLSFNTSTGLLSGSSPTLPNAVGVFNFSVTATDSKGCSVTQNYSLTVRPKVVDDTYNTPNAVLNTQAMTTAYTPAPTTPKATYSGTLLDNDESNAAMAVSAGAACSSGTIAFNPNGNWLYTPALGFSGPTATCGYTVTSNSVTNTGNLTITFSNRVWYVRNNSAAGGDGRSHLPFDTLAEAQAASAANDYIFVHFGDGTNTGQNSGFVMKNGQKLYGEGIALVVNTHNLVAAGTQPQIGNGGGAGVTILNLSGIEVRGLNIAGTSDAVSAVLNVASTVTLEVSDNTIRSAGNEGIDVDASAGVYHVSIHDNSVAATGTAIDIAESAAGQIVITTFDDNVIPGTSAGGGIGVVGATFDATPGGGIDPVAGGITTIGTSIDRIGNTGLSLTDVAGTLNFTDLDIFTDAGSALFADGAATGFTLTVGAGVSTLVANAGPAVALTDITNLDLQLAGMTSNNSVGNGVSLTNVTGTFSAPAGSSITNPTGTAFNISGGTVNSTYAGTIYDNTGTIVAVANSTGGTKTFSGAIDDLDGTGDPVGGGAANNGGGITLSNNTGATIRFNGGIDLSTGATPAFTATGGGTVEVCDENVCNAGATGALVNRIATTTGVTLNVANTTIGANNLEFRSIAANGAANGIILNTTGALGGLKVKGNGAAGTGGTIQSTTGVGILLTSTTSPAFNFMNIQSSGDDGIRGTSVSSLTLNTCNLTNNGNATAENGLQLGEASGLVVGITGTLTITSTNITGSAGNNVHIRNTSGNLAAMNITGGSFNDLNDVTGANSFLFEMSGTATTTAASISGGTQFHNNSPQRALEVQTHDSGVISAFTVNGASFNNNGIHASFTQDTTSNLTFQMLNNNMQFADPLHAINIFSSSTSTGGSITGTVEGNTIGTAATASSGAKGNAIRIALQGRTVGSFKIHNNVIRQVWLTGAGARGMDLQFLGPVAAAQPITQSDILISNNDIDTMAPASAFPLEAIFLAADNQGSPARVRAQITGNNARNSVAGGSYGYPTFDGNGAHLVFIENLPTAEGQLVDTGAASANALSELQTANPATTSTRIYQNGITLIPGPIVTPP